MSDEYLFDLIDAAGEAAAQMRGLESVAASMERTADDAAWAVVRQVASSCAAQLSAASAAARR